MNLNSLYTPQEAIALLGLGALMMGGMPMSQSPQEAIAWSAVGLLSILLVLNQGGADIYYDKTPYRDTGGFCRAYLNGEIL